MRIPNSCLWMVVVLFSGAAVNLHAQTWSFTGSMTTERAFQSATLLSNGEVLVAGGRQRGNEGLTSAELYNPSSGAFTLTGSLNTGRNSQMATLLQSGEVLIAGGWNEPSNEIVALASAELYKPSTGKFTVTGSMTTPRNNCAIGTCATATLLNNGMVLIAGGSYNGEVLSSAELYNPATGTFSATGSLNVARALHTASLLPNGEVLVAGGGTATGYLNSAELYNPSTGTFTLTGSLNVARDAFTATLLSNGEVLAAGGEGGDTPTNAWLASAELYNPSTGKWTLTGSLNTSRLGQTATLLNSGDVLIAGGNHSGSISSAELYNPSSGTFSVTASMNTARQDQPAVLLTDGEVLVPGGYDGNGGNTGYLATAELFDQ